MQHPDVGSQGIPLLTQGQATRICCHIPVKPESRLRRQHWCGNYRSLYCLPREQLQGLVCKLLCVKWPQSHITCDRYKYSYQNKKDDLNIIILLNFLIKCAFCSNARLCKNDFKITQRSHKGEYKSPKKYYLPKSGLTSLSCKSALAPLMSLHLSEVQR